MARKASLARKAQELADALAAREAQDDGEPAGFTPHEDTQRLLMRRGVDREQLNYSVPAALELKRRINAYNVDHGHPGPGNIAAGVLDAFLRAEGYPPDLKPLG
ncbi:hypothetical protein [Streptomyces lydicus]|uniref:hypothetical protein n=1 Tax=Streptomyces lydicus TaxID=47763 RepID=UPI001010BEA1|nr:hypothetical protein [Streptomyces lydicus]MCZ1012119.1 hypothetical protein [Streptomyces lydicus]